MSLSTRSSGVVVPHPLLVPCAHPQLGAAPAGVYIKMSLSLSGHFTPDNWLCYII